MEELATATILPDDFNPLTTVVPLLLLLVLVQLIDTNIDKLLVIVTFALCIEVIVSEEDFLLIWEYARLLSRIRRNLGRFNHDASWVAALGIWLFHATTALALDKCHVDKGLE